MKNRIQISTFSSVVLSILLIFTFALINLPTFNLVELSNLELYTDFENEQNNNEVDNELDEYINYSMVTFSNQTYSNLNTTNSSNHYQILFLDIESPPPDLNQYRIKKI